MEFSGHPARAVGFEERSDDVPLLMLIFAGWVNRHHTATHPAELLALSPTSNC